MCKLKARVLKLGTLAKTLQGNKYLVTNIEKIPSESKYRENSMRKQVSCDKYQVASVR